MGALAYWLGPLAPPSASTARRTAIAPSLSSGSFQFPHLGDCTHDGHPPSQRHAVITSSVASTCRRPAANPSSAIPPPPGEPSEITVVAPPGSRGAALGTPP